MNKVSLLATTAIMLLAAPISFAASQGDNNGKPFRELTEIIEGNRALIDANSADIATLQSAVSDMSDEIADIQSDLSGLEARVAANEGDIADLQTRLGDVEVDVDSLIAGLAQLRTDHNADMADIEAAIAAAESRIDTLQSDLQDLTVALNLRLSDIEGDVEDNAVAIDAMLLELTATTAKAVANMSAISGLQGQVDALVIRAAQHETDISDLQAQIDALEFGLAAVAGEVDVLQGYHCDSATEVSFGGKCYYLDGSNGVCDAGYTMAPQSILNTIAVDFQGKNYKNQVSSNCCIRHRDENSERQDWGMQASCNSPGPFQANEPRLNGAGCTNALNRSVRQLTLCQTQ